MGGSVVWKFGSYSKIDDLIKKCFLKGKMGDSYYESENVGKKWKVDAKSKLVFVAFYQHVPKNSDIVDKLLCVAKQTFLENYSYRCYDNISIEGFDAIFAKLLRDSSFLHYKQCVENEEMKPLPSVESHISDDYKNLSCNAAELADKGSEQQKNVCENFAETSGTLKCEDEFENPRKAFDVSRLKARSNKKGKHVVVAQKKQKGSKVEDDVEVELEFSKKSMLDTRAEPVEKAETCIERHQDKSWQNEIKEGIKEWFERRRTLNKEKVAQELKELLISRNVAEQVAARLCFSVLASLDGGNAANAMKETVERILVPNKKVDILQEIERRDKQRPYVIMFAGVNGVGKTTSIAKVAYWLKGYKLMLAAGDTFRSGALEQILHHRALLEKKGVDVCMTKRIEEILTLTAKEKSEKLAREYSNPPVRVAKEAIANAIELKKDVVILDTAGRMESDKCLMQELTNVIKAGKPNLVIFVVEAMVGSQGVEQISKFSEALGDTQAAILLTKTDIVDSKIGTVLSLAYTSSWPILFLGSGQMYEDLEKPDARLLAGLLLK